MWPPRRNCSSMPRLGKEAPGLLPVSLDVMPSPQDVRNAILSAKRGKASGPDALPGEIGLACSDALQAILFPLALNWVFGRRGGRLQRRLFDMVVERQGGARRMRLVPWNFTALNSWQGSPPSLPPPHTAALRAECVRVAAWRPQRS